MEMYTATAEDPGHSQIIQNIIHPLNRLQQNLHHNILLHNPRRLKARAAELMTNPVADLHLPARCQMPPVTGQEAALVQVPGVAAVQVVGAVADGAAEVEDSAVEGVDG